LDVCGPLSSIFFPRSLIFAGGVLRVAYCGWRIAGGILRVAYDDVRKRLSPLRVSTIIKTRSPAVTIHPRVCANHDIGMAGMFTSEAVARSSLRRQVLHWGPQHQNLLPLNLPCAYSEREKYPLFSQRSRSGGSWVPSLSALPAGMFAWNSGLGWNSEHSFESLAPDRGEWLGRWRNGGPRGTPGSRFAAPSTIVYPAPGRAAKRGGTDSPPALRQETDRRNQANHV
jgi:hypothetical protein